MFRFNNIKKVLFISYFFPPLGGAGVQRAQKFVKYLPQFGWKPYVLTVKPVEYVAYDDTLLKEIAFTPIYRTESLDPMRILHIFEKLRKNKRRIYNSADPKIKKLSRNIFPIDSKIGWLPFAYLKGLSLCKQKIIQVIYATLSPYSSAVLAYLLSRKTGLPYVLDYRDLWQGKPDIEYLTDWHKKISENWERNVLKNASKVIINTKRAMKKIMEIYPEIDKKKFTVIYNGFDEDDFKFEKTMKKNTDKIIFTYTGGFYGERTPKYFIEAVDLIKDKIKDKVKFRFVGNYHKNILKMLNSLPELIEVIPQVTHRKSIKYLSESDYSMLFIAEKKSDIVIPAKLFEYMAIRKPIIAMIPQKGEAADLIKEYGLGFIVPSNDVNKIKDTILQAIEHKIKITENKNLEKFTRRYQTKQLAQILDNI